MPGAAPTIGPITAGWHTLVRVWDGQQVRQYVDGLRTKTVAMSATGSWGSYSRAGSSPALGASMGPTWPFFGAFGAAWDDATVARWSANSPRHALAGDGLSVPG
jgi:hypothetical protein